MNKVHKKNRGEVLYSMMQDMGFSYLSKNIPMTEWFIKNNADKVEDSTVWMYMVLNQRHINPYFFDRFVVEMDETTKNMLSRRKVMYDLLQILKRV